MIVSALYAYSIMLPSRGPVLRGLTLDWCVFIHYTVHIDGSSVIVVIHAEVQDY